MDERTKIAIVGLSGVVMVVASAVMMWGWFALPFCVGGWMIARALAAHK